jgi:endoglucanase
VGDRGERHRLGQPVSVRLANVGVAESRMDFDWLAAGAPALPHGASSLPLCDSGTLCVRKDLQFLKELVEAPSPSGFEQPAATVFRARMASAADTVETNVMGSVHATLSGNRDDAPSIMLAGHIDEIGMMVTYVTPEGFLAFSAIGGVDAAILPGMRVRVHTKEGPLLGIMGRKPIHLIEEDERKNVTKLEKLFIDVGLTCDEIKDKVRIGDPITFDVGFEVFGDELAVSRAFDDKMGAWIARGARTSKAGRAARRL